MFKRYLSLTIVLIFIFTLMPFTLIEKVQAYQNSSYFTDLKIGLVSMSNTTMSITLNGEYNVNGQNYPSSTILNLKLNGTIIELNGALYSTISFLPKDIGNLLTLTSGTTINKYMGSFMLKVLNSKILPINTIDMENYLKGVVGYEMSDYYPIEALKAQAVAARNYSLARIGSESAKGYDIDDTISYQVYKGYNPTYKNVLRAVDETIGHVLLYNDKLVDTLYSAWHGGYTEDSENVWGNIVPYLKSLPDSYESDPWPNGNRTFTIADIQSNLVSKGYLLSTETFLQLDLNSIIKYISGRVSNINIIYKDSAGGTRTKSIAKDKTRTFLSLPSSMYNVVYDSVSKVYTFSGKGYGHGLGMSQIGAKNRAAAGQSFEQILKFYYQNSYLQNLVVKAVLNSISYSKDKMLIGENIVLNAAGSSGNGYGYLFKYVIKNGSNTVYTREYSFTSSLSYSPPSPGIYNVEVYIKDKYSSFDYDDRKDLSFTVFSNPTLNSFSTSKVETLVGQGIDVNLEAQGGSSSYLYKYIVTKDSTTILNREYLSDKQFIFTPQAAGNYTITAYMKDSLSSKEYDVKQSQDIIAHNALSLLAFAKDNENAFTGDIINFYTKLSGGSSKGIYYKYIVTKNGDLLLSTNFDGSSSFSYKPDFPGNYEVTVYTKDAMSELQYDAMSKLPFLVREPADVSNFTANRANGFNNEKLQFNASSSSTDSLFKFVVLKDSNPVYTGEFTDDPTFEYVPNSSGNYEAQVYVKNVFSSKGYDNMKSLAFTIMDYAEVASFTEDRTELLKNQEIKFTTSAAKGSGSYLYKYVVEKDCTAMQTADYSDNNTFTYIPSEDGVYSIKVYVKDILSGKDYDSMKTLDFNVLSDVKLNNVGLTTNKLLLGQKTIVNTSAIFGSGDYYYKFTVSNELGIIYSSDYALDNTFEYAPNSIGNYKISVFIKDKLSSNEFDDMKTLDVIAYAAPSASLSYSSSETFVNNPVNYSIDTTGGSGSQLYRFVVYKGTSLISDSGYSISDNFTFTPSKSGSYQVLAYIKDALSEKEYDSESAATLKVNFPTAQLGGVSINASSLFVGENITVSASAPVNSLYKYVVYKDNTGVLTKEFSGEASFTYTTLESGSYKIEIYVKHFLSENGYDDMGNITAVVYNSPEISSYLNDKPSILVGDTSVFTSASSGGTGQYLYKYVVMKGSSAELTTSFSGDGKFTYSPASSGDYVVYVYMKDILSTKEYDSYSYLNLKVSAKPQIYITSTMGFFYEGKNVDFTSKASGGSNTGICFKYELLKNGVITARTEYNNSENYTLVSPSSGIYTIRVYAKDNLSTASYDSIKEFSITILNKPLFLSKLPLSYGMTSNDVTSLQNALIKLGYLNTSATGYFGTATKSSVISFQSNNGLSGDGIVGVLTYNALNERLISKEGIKTLNY